MKLVTKKNEVGGHFFGVDFTHRIFTQDAQARKIGRAAELAEKRKIKKYKNTCETKGITSLPIVFEVGGRSGDLWLKEIQRLFNMHDQGGHQSFQQYWNMGISIALQMQPSSEKPHTKIHSAKNNRVALNMMIHS